jgi:hypothetical protein
MKAEPDLGRSEVACDLPSAGTVLMQCIGHDSKVEPGRDLRWDLHYCLLRLVTLAWVRNHLQRPEEDRVGV